jgi:hypothetical protein
MDPTNIQNYVYASLNDMANYIGEVQADLFFTPNKNFKFGLGYSYLSSSYFQITTAGSKGSRFGNNHSVRLGSWFYF